MSILSFTHRRSSTKNCKTGWDTILQEYINRCVINLDILRALLRFIELNINAEIAKSEALYLALKKGDMSVCQILLESQAVITPKIRELLTEEKYQDYRELFHHGESTVIEKEIVSVFLQRLLASKSVEEDIYTFATRHGLF